MGGLKWVWPTCTLPVLASNCLFNAGAYNGEEGTFLLTGLVSVHSAPNHPNHWPSYGCGSEKINLMKSTSLF